jgi:hypothetical protein
MSEQIRIYKYVLTLFLFILFIGTGCASVFKTNYPHKKKESNCTLAELVGSNTLFYSDHYKRTLKRSLKRIGVK